MRGNVNRHFGRKVVVLQAKTSREKRIPRPKTIIDGVSDS